MRDLKDIISNPDDLRGVTLEMREKVISNELRSGVIKLNKIINDRSLGGFGHVSLHDTDIQRVLKELHFVTWCEIASHFRDAGFRVEGEGYNIRWDND